MKGRNLNIIDFVKTMMRIDLLSKRQNLILVCFSLLFYYSPTRKLSPFQLKKLQCSTKNGFYQPTKTHSTIFMAHSSCHFYSLWISKGETKVFFKMFLFQKAGNFFWQEPGNVADKVVYAVNCGGDSHVDILGVHFSKDSNKVGTASDYGKQLLIGRVPQKDQILYQTERYHTSTFGYDIPIATDGRYLLVLKFSEVYFNTPNSKVNKTVMNEKWWW